MSGPKIPSRDEMNAREIDMATEAAARFSRLADQHGADTERGRWYRDAAKQTKEEIRELRRKPLF